MGATSTFATLLEEQTRAQQSRLPTAPLPSALGDHPLQPPILPVSPRHDDLRSLTDAPLATPPIDICVSAPSPSPQQQAQFTQELPSVVASPAGQIAFASESHAPPIAARAAMSLPIAAKWTDLIHPSLALTPIRAVAAHGLEQKAALKPSALPFIETDVICPAAPASTQTLTLATANGLSTPPASAPSASLQVSSPQVEPPGTAAWAGPMQVTATKAGPVQVKFARMSAAGAHPKAASIATLRGRTIQTFAKARAPHLAKRLIAARLKSNVVFAAALHDGAVTMRVSGLSSAGRMHLRQAVRALLARRGLIGATITINGVHDVSGESVTWR